METLESKLKVDEKTLLGEVIESLDMPQKSLPCKLFYDKHGSYLFDLISTLDEYYITRTEISILKKNIEKISGYLGKNPLLVELGSGSTKKIRIILDNIPTPSAYIPVDISEEYINEAVKLADDYPGLNIIPILADYTQPFNLPEINFDYNRIDVYYPGSTIGNFEPAKARKFLKRIAQMCGRNSGLLIGFDLKKDPLVLEKAYNDKAGVTAEFNLNILSNLNNSLGTNFNLGNWAHLAFYNSEKGRIEMHLKSLNDQKVKLNGRIFSFRKNETIHTENSYKYSIDEFSQMVADFYSVKKFWTDTENKFCILYMTAI